ncbi:MAG: TolC family protein [Deltaproteobacteria bacterium]|nr:TolC family protein [Deltaproteobacteria bacterium]
MKRAMVILAALSASTAFADPRPVSLKEALSLAAKQSPDLAVAQAQAKVAEAGIRKAWTAWQPDLSEVATFDHTSAPQSFNLNQIVQLDGYAYGLGKPNPAVIPAPIDIVASNSAYATLQLVQPLFSPQGLFLIPAAEAGAKAAALGAQDAREQILLATARTYLAQTATSEMLAAARDAEKTALAREQEARHRVDAGVGLPIELSRAQSEVAQSRAQIAALEGQQQALQAALVELTGEDVAPVAQVDASFGTPAQDASEPWQQTYAIQSAEAGVEAARKALQNDHFAWLPTVAGVAKGNYNSNAGFSGKNTSYDLIVTATLPLYDRGQRYANGAEDEAKLAQAEAALTAARAKSRANWQGAKANVTAAQAAMVQAQAALDFADQAKKQVEGAIAGGAATNLELSQADTNRFLAASALAQARANLATRQVEVAAAEGRLYATVAPQTN